MREGDLREACFGRVPLPAVLSLHLQMKVMDEFTNTKATTPQRDEDFLEGRTMFDKKLECSMKLSGDVMTAIMDGSKDSQESPQLVCPFVLVEWNVRIALVYYTSIS